ncbi:MAG: nucleotidyltransferase family protein [Anaerolineae bacterium]|nr:nucleotidyltransferase family protein [Anaerolineae bacterium]MCX8067388.1 nucleotidyltransferase family protein [Anaerolineae bacterium]MDW7991864.1 nucleotidyltransferase family protein [Anaerolineae bacterium]
MGLVVLGDILDVLRRHKSELSEKYGVRAIGIFGSCVRGEQTETSDVDVLVEFDPEARVSLLDFVQLEEHLTQLLGVQVDLVEGSALKPRISQRVFAEVVYV